MSWDDVGDWLARLERDGDALLRVTLEQVADAPPDEELEHAACEHAIAAAEIVASCAGVPPDDVPGPVRRYAERCGVPSSERIAAAFRAVERIGLERDEHDAALVDLGERLGSLLSA